MDKLEKIISLTKRRGFIFPGSEIYGGMANTYDFGPLGVMMKKNIQDYWWNFFVSSRDDILPIDSSNIMSPRVWEASGHTQSFTNVLIDCKNCNYRTRADHLIEDGVSGIGNVEGYSLDKLDEIINSHSLKCPKCQASEWTKCRNFNQLFETKVGIITDDKNTAYLRGELAQGMFVNFKNILDSMHPKLPFGIAQSGKVYRNEITMGKFTFRTLEFDLSEFEYFVESKDWEKYFEYWKEKMYEFAISIGLDKNRIRWRSHKKEELSHYSQRTEDLEYEFPWGFKEMWGLAYRSDYDLQNHSIKSGVDMSYIDPYTNNRFIPHVIEPTFGISRLFTIMLMNSYTEENERIYLKLSPKIAPYKLAVFPLLKNKPELVEKARGIYNDLRTRYSVSWDDRGNIGKRYYSQDEIGTPWCITVDFETLENNTITIRERDTQQQIRVSIEKIGEYLDNKL